jgi:hypothetical protein
VATIEAEPAAIVVTRPLEETVASCGAALLHVTERPVNTAPDASRRTAVACAVCPTFTFVALNDTATVATGSGAAGSTVIAAFADLPSTVATMFAFPTETPVTRPSAETVATAAFDDAHVGTREPSRFPLPSYAVAVSCSGSPTSTCEVDGVTATLAAVTAADVNEA